MIILGSLAMVVLLHPSIHWKLHLVYKAGLASPVADMGKLEILGSGVFLEIPP